MESTASPRSSVTWRTSLIPSLASESDQVAGRTASLHFEVGFEMRGKQLESSGIRPLMNQAAHELLTLVMAGTVLCDGVESGLNINRLDLTRLPSRHG
jgi:hypothetical protein